MLFGALYLLIFVGYPSGVFLSLTKAPFHRFFNGDQFGGGAGATFLIYSLFHLDLLADVIVILIMVYVILIHTNSTRLWLNLCTHIM
jgi:hypothetical protein